VTVVLACLIVVSPLPSAQAAPTGAPLPNSLPVPAGARLPFDTDKTVYYTSGPHASDNIGGSDGSYVQVDVASADGIDFSGGKDNENFPVLAIARGKLIGLNDWNGTSFGEGTSVWIEHEEAGVVSEYWHLSEVDGDLRKVWEGAGEKIVDRGRVLGKAGKTGQTQAGAAVHLHLRIRASESKKAERFFWHGRTIDGYAIWMYRVPEDDLKGYNYQGSATTGEHKDERIKPRSCTSDLQNWFALATVGKNFTHDEELNVAPTNPNPKTDPNTLFAAACGIQAPMTANRQPPPVVPVPVVIPPGGPKPTTPPPATSWWDRLIEGPRKRVEETWDGITRMPGDVAAWIGDQYKQKKRAAEEKMAETGAWLQRELDERWKQAQAAAAEMFDELWRQAEVALASLLETLARELAAQADKAVRQMCGAAFLPPIAFAVLSLVSWRRRRP
jgi:hypothetical protein